MLTNELTFEQLDALIAQAAGREMTPNEAFEYCEQHGLNAVTDSTVRQGSDRYVCTYEGGEVRAETSVLAIKRAFVLKHFGDTVELDA